MIPSPRETKSAPATLPTFQKPRRGRRPHSPPPLQRPSRRHRKKAPSAYRASRRGLCRSISHSRRTPSGRAKSDTRTERRTAAGTTLRLA